MYSLIFILKYINLVINQKKELKIDGSSCTTVNIDHKNGPNSGNEEKTSKFKEFL